MQNIDDMARRTFVMGDIHGAHKALMQCFERSGFDYAKDRLIQLGDIVDGHQEAFECVEELLKLKELISIKGNHDVWFKDFMDSGYHPMQWRYGGGATIISYLRNVLPDGVIIPKGGSFKTSLNARDIPATHLDFFANQILYYVDPENRLFVHAGYDPRLRFEDQEESAYYFDRSLWTNAVERSRSPQSNILVERTMDFNKIFIGHTATTYWDTDLPMEALHITNLDTDAGHDGKLTIMDVNTKEYWQSDRLPTLYPAHFGDLR